MADLHLKNFAETMPNVEECCWFDMLCMPDGFEGVVGMKLEDWVVVVALDYWPTKVVE